MPSEIYAPPPAFHFSVSISGGEQNDAKFQEVSGLEVEVEVEDVAEGGFNNYKHRLPVRTRFNNLVLKRGLAVQSSKFVEWVTRNLLSDTNFDEPIELKDIVVSLKNEHNDEIMHWTFTGAYPVKWSLNNLNAQENSIAIESLEFAYKKFNIEQ